MNVLIHMADGTYRSANDMKDIAPGDLSDAATANLDFVRGTLGLLGDALMKEDVDIGYPVGTVLLEADKRMIALRTIAAEMARRLGVDAGVATKTDA